MKNFITTNLLKKRMLAVILSIFCIFTTMESLNYSKVQAASKTKHIYYYVKKFFHKKSTNYMSLDMIYMIRDTHYDDDYCIVNNNKKLRTYEISNKAKFYIVNCMPDFCVTHKVNYKKFKSHMLSPVSTFIKIKLKNHKIIEAREIFVP